MLNKEKIIKGMTNVKADFDKIKRIENIRESYKKVVESLDQNCGDSRELDIAIVNLEQSLMFAVKSIVLYKN